ncbi:amidase signature domain-containing protein [Neohortaea acidophila]|uniref:amidase n=1 Tax=Neohortaea acidophila TaxID=245834 RepID=A0A6A6PZZ9_9PEZI|nr:amidase signature domain-containing protein [Neohortaea acidophila]KAF2485720.1 amidase signature domain-containing protein [Neohortaea acidophila]
MADTWRSIASRKQEERASRIPHAWLLPSSIDPNRHDVLDVPRESGILSPAELRLTGEYDATALLAGLGSGLLKSVDVVTAFCKRAAIAQQVSNCLTEIFFHDAIARARELDAYFAKTRKPIGPLHGLPISIKDSFQVRGYDASLGVAALCFRPSTSNSALVELLLSLGAVLYCKTNVPLTMMALDSHNNVFGRTLNPADRRLTAGGSSGGEGALVAMRGSILGIGTDVGGSIRVPAYCNGIYGVKPSHGRVPYAGQAIGGPAGSSKLAIESTAGPIGVSVRDCELLLRVISDSDAASRDPDVVSQTWQEQRALSISRSLFVKSQPLRVGIVRTDGHVTPLPPIQHFIDEVAHTLSSHGSRIEVVDLDIGTLGAQCLKAFNGIVSIEGANNWFDLLEKTGEPISPWLSTRLRRRPQKSVNEVRSLQAQRTSLLTQCLDIWHEKGGYWNTSDSRARRGERSVDVIICPAAPHPVPPIDRWNSANYTSMFNLLDWPAAVLPVRKFQERDLRGEVGGAEALNGWDKVNRELWTKVDRAVYVGSPLSVQVVAPRLMERKLVESLAVLEKALEPLREKDLNSKSRL